MPSVFTGDVDPEFAEQFAKEFALLQLDRADCPYTDLIDVEETLQEAYKQTCAWHVWHRHQKD